MINLQLIFRYKTLNKAKVLDAVGRLPEIVDVKLKGFSGYSKRMKASHRPSFNLDTEGLAVGCGESGRYKFGHVLIDFGIDSVHAADSIVKLFLQCGDFIYARAVSYQYRFWQNIDCPDAYERRGRSYEGLPMRHNEKPSPLDRMIIDTTSNPGREVFCEGYKEAVGGVAWYSEAFFGITGSNRDELLAQDEYEISEEEGIIRVILDKNFLADAEGDKKLEEKQNKLRKILYPA